MRCSILVDVPNDIAKQLFSTERVEVEMRNYDTGYQFRSRPGQHVLTAGDNVSEVVALRVVQLLKEWNGEKPLDASEVRLT